MFSKKESQCIINTIDVPCIVNSCQCVIFTNEDAFFSLQLT